MYCNRQLASAEREHLRQVLVLEIESSGQLVVFFIEGAAGYEDSYFHGFRELVETARRAVSTILRLPGKSFSGVARRAHFGEASFSRIIGGTPLLRTNWLKLATSLSSTCMSRPSNSECLGLRSSKRVCEPAVGAPSAPATSLYKVTNWLSSRPG